MKFWAVTGAQVTDNYVHDNKGVGLWADTNNHGMNFEGNYISNNDDEGLFYEISYNAFDPRQHVRAQRPGQGTDQPRLPDRRDLPVGERRRLAGRRRQVRDPRHLRQRVHRQLVGRDHVGERRPLLRLAGQHVRRRLHARRTRRRQPQDVHRGERRHMRRTTTTAGGRRRTCRCTTTRSTSTLPTSPACKFANGCGFNGIFSNWGTYPSWSPYKGAVIENAITFHQNNVFADNTYTGRGSSC